MIKKQEVNIKVIAQKAGVSIATVSRFLNGQLDRMSQTTAEKVRAVIDKYGYVPNPAARQLMTHSSKLIAVVVANIDDYFSTEAYKGAASILEKKKYTAVLFDSNSDLKRETAILEMINHQNFDGIIIQPLQTDSNKIKKYIKRDIPVITFDRHFENSEWVSVVSNNEVVAKEASQSFQKEGIQNCIIVSEPVKGVSTREERVEGIKKIYPSAKVLEIKSGKALDGYKKLRQTLKTDEKTVVFILKERIILSLLPFILRDNLLENGNLSLAGFADTNLIQELSEDIRLIRQRPFLMGTTAADMMDKELNDKKIEQKNVIPAIFS